MNTENEIHLAKTTKVENLLLMHESHAHHTYHVISLRFALQHTFVLNVFDCTATYQRKCKTTQHMLYICDLLVLNKKCVTIENTFFREFPSCERRKKNSWNGNYVVWMILQENSQQKIHLKWQKYASLANMKIWVSSWLKINFFFR